MPAYARMSTDSPEVIKDVIVYGRIVCVFSIGLFTESIWDKRFYRRMEICGHR